MSSIPRPSAPSDIPRLAKKVAVITGGAGGIGAATGWLFCKEGARVVLVDRDAEAMAAICAEICVAAPGAVLLDLICDTAEEAAAVRIVAEVIRAFSRIDVLVNNAGIRSYEPLAEATSETWLRILDTNLLSHAYLPREAFSADSASRGNIVSITSTRAVNPHAGMGQYDAVKAAIVPLTKALAFEEAAHGVRVNAICPGATLTPFHIRRLAA